MDLAKKGLDWIGKRVKKNRKGRDRNGAGTELDGLGEALNRCGKDTPRDEAKRTEVA